MTGRLGRSGCGGIVRPGLRIPGRCILQPAVQAGHGDGRAPVVAFEFQYDPVVVESALLLLQFLEYLAEPVVVLHAAEFQGDELLELFACLGP